MCGIAGIVGLSDTYSPEQLKQLADGMQRAMAYRGPDDSGVWLSPDGRCALAHRRLSIIDTSADGHQPMVSASGRSVIAFNGEIYNYAELKEKLLAKGVRFRSRTDTEVLLLGLETYGTDFLDELDGMYAFGFWDTERRTLTLARDNFGEKPLYYARTKDYFAFSSELHPLAALPGFDDGVELWRVATYLSFQYLPAPHSIYRGAAKLPPGHLLTLAADGRMRLSRHFVFRTSAQQASRRKLDDLADELEAILVETVRDRLVSDVPLGAFLSGGVDSSTVVAMVTRKLGRSIKTFSMGFADTPETEHEMARQMAGILGGDHQDRVLSPDVVAMARHVGMVLDEPNGDSSCLPTLLLSRLAREQVTVALSGDGGDEMFGGYGRYFSMLHDAQCKADGNPKLAQWQPGCAYYSARILYFPDHDLTSFLGTIPAETAAILEGLRSGITGDARPLGNVLRESDALNYLPGAVLAKVDRMSMQASLEVRAPLLGRRVAEFAMGLAAEDCFLPGEGKRILKQVACRYIPGEIVRRPKMGFGLPMRAWGLEPLLGAVVRELSDPACRLAEWIPASQLAGFIQRQQKNPQIYQLWSTLILETWLRHHPASPAGISHHAAAMS